jgi:hypothetical protein
MKATKVGTAKGVSDKENLTNLPLDDDSDDDDDKVTVESPNKSLNITPPGSVSDPEPHKIGFLDPDPGVVKSVKTTRKNGAKNRKSI